MGTFHFGDRFSLSWKIGRLEGGLIDVNYSIDVTDEIGLTCYNTDVFSSNSRYDQTGSVFSQTLLFEVKHNW